jgi:WD40 repeat protein
LASSSLDETVKIHNVSSGTTVCDVAKHDIAASCVEFSDDFSFIVSGGYDGKIVFNKF